MLLPAECERCGGSTLVHGLVAGASFTLKDSPAIQSLKITGGTSSASGPARTGLAITATACLSCGNIHLTTDLQKLAALTGHKLPTMQPAKSNLRFRPEE